MNIGICDDEMFYVERISSMVTAYLEQREITYNIFCFYSGEGLLNSKQPLDLIFLDVKLGAIDGIETAKQIRRMNAETLIIFVSAYVECATEGYEVSAFRYLLKDSLDRLFNGCMDAVIQIMDARKKFIEVKQKGVPIQIRLQGIIYVESFYKKLEIHTEHEGQIEVYDTMKAMEIMLPQSSFLKIHRSYIVQMRYIEKLGGYKALLRNSESLTVSKSYYNKILDKYTLWRSTDHD